MKQRGLILGRCEWVSLPDLDISAIPAKIDTGAKSSSIHAYDIHIQEKNGQEFVSFDLHPIKQKETLVIRCEAPVLKYINVKSSSGHIQRRPFIRTKIKMAGYLWDIDLNLTNRDEMGFRMIIGREAINKRALIDPALKYIHGNLDLNTAIETYKELL